MARAIRGVVVLGFLLALTGGTVGGPYGESYKVKGSTSYGYFGISLANAGDQDGDEIDDYIAGSSGAGQATVHSGADGSVIHTLSGSGGDDFGTSVASIPDLDGDGLRDFIAGAPSYDYAKVFSSKTGKEIYHLKGTNGGEYFGQSVAGIDDLDGDGAGDFAVGAVYGYDPNWNQTGYVNVYSGSGGKLLYTTYGIKNDEYGRSIAAGADVDGDGYGDFAVGASTGVDPNAGTSPGYVDIVSGQTGKLIGTIYGDSDWSYFGWSVALAGDVDDDGYPDIVIGAYYEYTPYGYYGMVRVVSGADGSNLHTMYAGTSGMEEYYLGYSVCGLGDMDGDGADDFAAGGPYLVSPDGYWSGGVRCWSGATGEELITLYSEGDWIEFGDSICALTDGSTGDHYGLVAGAPYDNEGADAAGAVHLFKELQIEGTVEINGGAAYTDSPDVTLSLTYSSPQGKVTDVRIRNVDEDWGDWMAVEETVDWTLLDGDGPKQVEVEYRDDYGESRAFLSDTIILDTAPPVGSLTLAGGAAWTNQNPVDVALPFTDSGSGVADARLRNEGGAFGSWFDPASPPQWALTSGEGMKTVQAECRDHAGNVSSLVSASIGLDQTPPSGSVSIEAGATYAPSHVVTLTLSATDTGGSGVASMRFKPSGPTPWGAWVPWAPTYTYSLPVGDGAKGVDAQFADGAGNVSPVASDSVILDETPPSLTSFSVSTGFPYVMPGNAFDIQVTAEDGTGSGVDAFRITYDGGVTFTEWFLYSPVPASVDHPGLNGEYPVQVSVRDRAGNTSGLSVPSPVFFVGADCPRLLPRGTFTGTLATADKLVPVAVDLVEGDVFSMKVKRLPAVKGDLFPLVFDIWLEDGTLLATGVPALSGWAASRTGRCYMVARLVGPPFSYGSFTLTAGVKQNKAAARVKGTVDTGEVEFEASDGSSLKAGLKGAGVDPASIVLTGPEGPVAVTATGKPGSVKFSCVLDQGTGVYRLRFASTGPVKVSLATRLPKGGPISEP